MGKKEEQEGDWKEGGERVGVGQYDGYMDLPFNLESIGLLFKQKFS